jgi:hypothetical protein
MKKKINPHCVVAGCRTKKPHLDDSTVHALHHQFSDPASRVQTPVRQSDT